MNDLFGPSSEKSESEKSGSVKAGSKSPAKPARAESETRLPLPARDDLEYSAKDIEVLEGLEPVRKRPGMYIGGTDEAALHHLAAEILDNAMDEAVAGHASFIEVTLEAGNWLTVRDNGRGIPVDPHPKFRNLSALEVILTTLHSGGKFGGKAYATSGGLHGVGSSVVNALSEMMEVEVARDRVLWKQSYAKGKPTTKLINAGPVHNRRGTIDPFQAGYGDFRAAGVRAEPAVSALPVQGVSVSWRRDPVELRPGAAAGRQGRGSGRGGAAFPGRTAGQSRGRYRRPGQGAAADLGRRGRFAGGSDRQGRMGGGLAGAGRRISPFLLQHRADDAGRDARGRVSCRVGEGAAGLGRSAGQQAGGTDHRGRRSWTRWRRSCRCSCAIRSSRARPRRS